MVSELWLRHRACVPYSRSHDMHQIVCMHDAADEAEHRLPQYDLHTWTSEREVLGGMRLISADCHD